MTEKTKMPWWRNPWLQGLALLAVLHATGMAVHVQAALQRVVLQTGLFHPDVIPQDERAVTDGQFLVSTPSGDQFELADLQGQVVFINFWATWCPPCLAELPAIETIYQDYGDRVRFVLVSLDDESGTATSFMTNKDYEAPVVFPASRIPTSLTTGVIPTTVVMDRQGRTAVHETGMADYDSKRFRAALDKLIAE